MYTYNDKSYTWDELAEQFPAMWIIYNNCKIEGSDTVSGDIRVILPDDQLIPFLNEHVKEVPFYERTTDDLCGITGGYIHGELVED